MRTTLSLDDDVVSLLEKEIRQSGASFKVTVNYFLRLGLMASKKQTMKPFQVKPRPLGLSPGMNYDNVEELLESLEGDNHK